VSLDQEALLHLQQRLRRAEFLVFSWRREAVAMLKEREKLTDEEVQEYINSVENSLFGALRFKYGKAFDDILAKVFGN
jgi:hypothetical protein